MYETLRGNSDFVSKLSAVLKGTAVAALVAGLSLPAFGQTTTTTGPSALFCTVTTVLPPGTTAASTSTTTIPVVTGSLIPGSAGSTLSCGTFQGTQNLQNLAFTAEGIVPADFVLSSAALTLPNNVFASLMAGTSELRDVVSLSGNTMIVDLFTTPATAAFPTSPNSMTGGALAVTPAGSLLSEFRMQVSNIIVTDGTTTPTISFSGVVTSNTTGTTSTTTTGTTTVTTGGATVGVTNSSGTSATSATSATGMTTSVGMVPTLFGNIIGRAASVSLAFNGRITFPGLGTTPLVTGATAFGPTTAAASFMQVSVAGSFVLASPTTSATFNLPMTPSTFQTTTTTTGTTGTTTGGGM